MRTTLTALQTMRGKDEKIAVLTVPDQPAGSLYACRAPEGGGRADGQAGRRRGDGRDGGISHRAGHPGMRAYRPDAAIGASDGRLSRTGQGACRRAEIIGGRG